MTAEAMKAKLYEIKCFLLDMDGTFYLGERLLPGSLSFLQRLEETGRSALFVTNNSSKSAAQYCKKLERMGVPERFRQVLTSGQAAGRYALSHFQGKKAFLLGNPMLRGEMEGMGVKLSNDCPDYVLMGYDTTLDYEKLTRCCDLVRAGLPYIATHPDANCPTEDGYAPDIGAMIAFVEVSTGRRPDLILGKPYAGIVEEALRRTGLPKRQLAMVGDRLYTDIATGVNFGMTSILVLTGEAGEADVQESPVKPDMIFERLSAMNEFL